MDTKTPQAVESCHGLLLWLIPLLDNFPRNRRFSIGSFVGWVRNAIQHLCTRKHGLVGWRYAYPTYQLTDLTHYNFLNKSL